LILGRVSNLPTVWSNCLGAWLLAGGGSGSRFLLLILGASAIYVGGMFLNDASDSEFDRRHRRERPIPAGAVGEREVWLVAGGSLLLGAIAMGILGRATLFLGILLVLAVIIYNLTHKFIEFSPAVMALCRYLLFLAAGSAAVMGVTGTVVWSALVLGGYVVGLSYVAKGETLGGLRRWWPLGGLVLPLVLAGFVNPPADWVNAVVAAPATMLVLWMISSLSHLFRKGSGGPRRTVSGLLAGICLVDLLAVAPSPFPWGVAFLGFFGVALLLQRWVPAT
jgi:4-hydroxybenzoate polyprenyltransferase